MELDTTTESTDSFAVEVGKTVLISAAASAATLLGLVTFGFVYEKVTSFAAKRRAKKTLAIAE